MHSAALSRTDQSFFPLYIFEHGCKDEYLSILYPLDRKAKRSSVTRFTVTMLSSAQNVEKGMLSKAFGTGHASIRDKRTEDNRKAGSDFAAFLSFAVQSQGSSANHQFNLQGSQSLPVLQIKNSHKSTQSVNTTSKAQINKIGHAVRSIYNDTTNDSRSSTDFSFESLYQATDEIIVVFKTANDLYERVQLEMGRAMGQIATDLRACTSVEPQNDSKSHFAWLLKLTEAWKKWCDCTRLVCNVLVLLDQMYLLKQSQLPSLWNLAMDLFKQSICLGDGIESRIQSSIVHACTMMRKTDSREYKHLHAEILPLFTTLDLYDILEKVLLGATKSYFEELSDTSINEQSVKMYLVEAEKIVQQEREYSTWLFNDASGGSKNLKIVYEQLITQHVEKLIGSLSDLLSDANDSLQALSLLYAFLSDVKKLNPLRKAFAQYICLQGEKIVMDKEKDDTMIERLLEYKHTIDHIVANAFKEDEGFRQTQKDNFETFVNKRQNKPAELIAKFLDSRLRSGNRTMSDQEMEHVLNEALVLFRYTHAKDMFEEFYKRLFAKRLLLNRSASSDAEQSMLLKLKEECGAAFTQKLETMLTDIALSDEMMSAYNSSKDKMLEQQSGIEPFELNVNVLTQAHWPTYPQVEVIIPQEMATATERFANFYKTRNQGRTLHWTHSLGTTSITAQFAKAGEKELLVSTFQAVVLLLFNPLPPGSKLEYVQIRQQTGLEEKELKRTLQSLACGQIPTRILRKEPQGKEVNESDQFMINEQLKNERKRIRINMIQLNETQEEQKNTVDRVMFDRELVLQATAVRILKAKKTIKHAELLQEIVQAIASRFTVDVGEIKKTFEILIDKEYMERVEGQRGMYRYLA